MAKFEPQGPTGRWRNQKLHFKNEDLTRELYVEKSQILGAVNTASPLSNEPKNVSFGLVVAKL